MRNDRLTGRRGNSFKAACVLGLACLLASVAFAADGRSRVTVETVSGESVDKSGLRSVDGGTVTFADGSSLPVDDLRSLRFAPAEQAPKTDLGSVVHLAGGGRLPVRDAVLVDDACEATLPDGRKTTLSLDDVAAIQWGESSDAAWAESLLKPSEEHDYVVLKAQPQATAVRAFVEAIGPESIEFDWDKQTRTLQKPQVIGVVFARPEKPSPVNVRVQTSAGAVLPVKKFEPAAEANQVRCTLTRGSVIEIPSGDIVSIRVQSFRMKWLSELTPARVIERPIAAFPRGWKADLNVRGEPLKAGSQIFDRGLGVQSGTSLSYDLDGTAEQFAAVLAIDAPEGIAGDCEFVVVADDQELARRHVKSGDEPTLVRVPLNGAKRLELRVDYGSNLDFGDHANWCDAHLVVKQPAASSL